MKHILSIFCLLVFTLSVKAQSDTLRILTSAECNTCKKTLEKEMSYVKGVKAVTLEVESKVLTVIYNATKTDPARIREAVAKVGYDADSIPADKKAYDRLPECCRKGGHQH